MTDYQNKQYKLLETIEIQFKDNKSPTQIVETTDDYKNDPKICLTAVSFLPGKLARTINDRLVIPLQKSDLKQFFFLPESLHITIKNIRTLNDPPLYNNQDINNAIKVFDEVIKRHKVIKFQLKGLFELPTSLGIRAYCDESLKNLALDLDEGLNTIGTPDNKKYASNEIFFGNVTICRYTTQPNTKFIEIINKLKEEYFGELLIKKISLITTNTAVDPKKTKIIKQYNLK